MPDVSGFVADMGALVEQSDETNPESLLQRLIGSDPDAFSVEEMLSNEGIALLKEWMQQ